MALARSFVDSSLQPNVPGPLTSCAPMCWFGCHTETNEPTASWATPIVPASKTSIGPMTAVPPLAATFFRVSSASVTVT